MRGLFAVAKQPIHGVLLRLGFNVILEIRPDPQSKWVVSKTHSAYARCWKYEANALKGIEAESESENFLCSTMLHVIWTRVLEW